MFDGTRENPWRPGTQLRKKNRDQKRKVQLKPYRKKKARSKIKEGEQNLPSRNQASAGHETRARGHIAFLKPENNNQSQVQGKNSSYE